MVKIKEGYGMTRDGRKVRIKRNEFSSKYPYYHDDNGFHSITPEGETCAGIDKHDIVAMLDDDATGPVRTVTRRKIVPGVYGRVDVGSTNPIGSNEPDSVLIGLTTVGGGSGFQLSFDPAELRSAAMIFSQLAEALDSNEETK